MQVRCIRAFGDTAPGDVVDVPDGAAVDPEHFVVIAAPKPASAPAAAATVKPAEGM